MSSLFRVRINAHPYIHLTFLKTFVCNLYMHSEHLIINPLHI